MNSSFRLAEDWRSTSETDSCFRYLEFISAALPARLTDRDHLTPRQLEILRMLAGGASTVGIATELYLSVETVRWHIKSILRKLGVRSRADAIACLEELQAV